MVFGFALKRSNKSSMETQWTLHNGKRILQVDYSNCKTSEDLLSVLHKAIVQEKSFPDNQGLTLADFSGSCAISTQYMEEAKKLGVEIRNQKVAKTALLGITGIRKVLLGAYQMFTGDRNTRAFDNKKSALMWLTN